MTELRNQLFRVFKMIDAGEDVTIIKKDSGKKYKIVAIKEKPEKDIVKIAKQMGQIKSGLGSLSPKEIRKIIETKYD